MPMKLAFTLADIVTISIGANQARSQSVTFNFEDGTDQGFGAGFGNDASKTFSIINIGGSLRMCVPRTGAFQEAGRENQGPDAFLLAMNAGTLAPSAYVISYDW